MADNYLEKKHEQYLQKKAQWERKRKLGLLKKKSKSGGVASESSSQDNSK